MEMAKSTLVVWSALFDTDITNSKKHNTAVFTSARRPVLRPETSSSGAVNEVWTVSLLLPILLLWGMHNRCLIYRKIVQYVRRKIFASVDMHECAYRRFLFAGSEDQAKVVLQSVYHKASHFFFVIFSYNGKMIDVALSFRSADKLRYQSQKKGFYECTFVRRCDLSVEIRHDKLRAGKGWIMNIRLRILSKAF